MTTLGAIIGTFIINGWGVNGAVRIDVVESMKFRESRKINEFHHSGESEAY